MPAYSKIEFSCENYRDLEIKPNSLIYCDAPYKNTKAYGINSKFNYSDYYKWLVKIAKTTPIFISEQEIPIDLVPATIIWEKEVKRDIDPAKSKIAKPERLYYLDLRN